MNGTSLGYLNERHPRIFALRVSAFYLLSVNDLGSLEATTSGLHNVGVMTKMIEVVGMERERERSIDGETAESPSLRRPEDTRQAFSISHFLPSDASAFYHYYYSILTRTRNLQSGVSPLPFANTHS